LILLSSLPESYDHIVTTMLFDKETLIFEEVTSTLLSNEIRKKTKSRGAYKIRFGDHGKKRKRRRKKRLRLIKDVSLLSQGRSLEEWLQASTRVAEEEGASCGGRRSKQCRGHQNINGFLRIQDFSRYRLDI